MEQTNFFQSKIFKICLLVLVWLISLLLVFKAGLLIGLTKARFNFSWGENYQDNFLGRRPGPSKMMIRDLDDRLLMPAHGVAGQIIKLNGLELVIKGDDGAEKIVLVNDQTEIREFQDKAALADLKIDDFIVVIGEPNETGQIAAKFIRLMPPRPSSGLFEPIMGLPRHLKI
ncbi:MAG: hypothetical protein WCV73_02535 [Patescibacteria group bacterium]|jgi:hypothetical protein